MKILFRKVYKLILLFLFLSVLAGLVDVFFASTVQKLIDSVTEQSTRNLILSIYLFFIFIIVNLGLNIVLNLVSVHLTEKFHILIKQHILNFLMHSSLAEFNSTTHSEKLNYFEYDLEVYEQYYFQNLMSIGQNIFVLLFSLCFLINVSYIMTITVIISAVIVIVLPGFFGKNLDNLTQQYSRSKSLFLLKLNDIFHGFNDIQLFEATENFQKNITESISLMEHDQKKLSFHVSLMGQVISTSQYLTLIIAFCVGGILVFQGEMTLGMLVASVQITNSVIQPMQQLATSFLEIIGSRSITTKINKMIYQPISKSHVPVKVRESIQICDVSVESSDKQNILEDINLKVEVGKKYAIIGKSGAGKTSLLNLIACNLNPNKGMIIIDGIPFENNKFSMIDITYIRQDSYLFQETIEGNVAMLKDYSKDQINNAMEKAAINFDKATDRKDQTDVLSLSGGEKQRIAIARTYLRKSNIVLLDEISSALDNLTKKEVMRNILSEVNKTMIFVTHDLSEEILGVVDEIILMDEGKVLDIGSYQSIRNHQFFNGKVNK